MSKTAPKTTGKTFSFVALHNQLDKTLARLQKQTQTKKRDKLISLVKKMRASSPCPQIMLIDLGA